jgi:hypothetical protein
MSAWRKAALQFLPEYRNIIEAAPQVMGAWVELSGKFQSAYEEKKVDRDIIRRFYAFARWCVEHPSTSSEAQFDPPTAAIVCFYEHLPTIPKALEDITIYLTPTEFKCLEPVFSYHGTESQIAVLRAKYGQKS